jgi:hypothetical protein
MKPYRLLQNITALATLAVAAGIIVPAFGAAEKPETAAQKKARLVREELAKYDKNLNGKLDADEAATLKTDKNKAAAEKRKATIQKKKEEAAVKAVGTQ